MNRTPRFTPVDPMPHPDGTVVHSSARAVVEMGGKTMRAQRLVMAVKAGTLQVFFSCERRTKAKR